MAFGERHRTGVPFGFVVGAAASVIGIYLFLGQSRVGQHDKYARPGGALPDRLDKTRILTEVDPACPLTTTGADID